MKVKIKTWNKMAEEYGEYEGDIDIGYGFTRAMESSLPANRIIELDVDNMWDIWDMSAGMIEETYSLEARVEALETKVASLLQNDNFIGKALDLIKDKGLQEQLDHAMALLRKRRCDTCKYEELSSTEDPCKECSLKGGDAWELEEPI